MLNERAFSRQVNGPGVIFRVHGDENTEKGSRYERGSG
jgi:hypothetical protein